MNYREIVNELISFRIHVEKNNDSLNREISLELFERKLNQFHEFLILEKLNESEIEGILKEVYTRIDIELRGNTFNSEENKESKLESVLLPHHWVKENVFQLAKREKPIGAITNSNGTLLALSVNSGKIYIWNTESGDLVHTIQDVYTYSYEIQFSPDNQEILYIGKGRDLKRTKIGYSSDSILSGSDEIKFYNYNHSGDAILVGTRSGSIKVFDSRSGKKVFEFNEHENSVRWIDIDQRNKYLISCSYDETCIVWDFQKKKKLHVLKGHKNYVTYCKIVPETDLVVTSGSELKSKIWNFKTGELIHEISGKIGDHARSSFSPDFDKMITIDTDRKLNICNIGDGLCQKIQAPAGQAFSHAFFAPNGKKVLTFIGGKKVDIWDTGTGKYEEKLQFENVNFPFLIHMDSYQLFIPGYRDSYLGYRFVPIDVK